MSTLTQPGPARPYRTPVAVRRLLMLIAALVALFMVAGGTINLLDLMSRHTTTETTTYDGVRSIAIDNAADVRLVGVPAGGPVRVVARVTEGLRSPDHEAGMSADGTLRLSSSCPLLFTGHCDVRYDVTVPRDVEVRARASGGDIVAEELTSDRPIELRSSAGDVSVSDVTAPELQLSSSAGEVEARGVSARQVRAHSSAGDVAVAMIVAPDRLDADSSAGDVSVLVPDRFYRLDASSSAGDVDTGRTRIDPDAPRSIRARSSAGDVQVDVRR